MAHILFDLDGTIITNDAEVEDTPIAEVLHRVKAAGHALGWNSDTSTAGLKMWEGILGIKSGTMSIYIGENGGTIDGFDLAVEYMQDAGQVRDEYAFFMNLLIGKAREAGYQVILTHPSSWAKQTSWMPPVSDRVVALDVTRVRSFTCEVRRVDLAGMLSIDAELTKEFGGLVHETGRRCFRRDFTHEAGDRFVDLPCPVANKGMALRAIREHTDPSVPIYMVGNGSNDVSCAGIKGVTLVAVADSRPSLLEVADRVTSAPCSRGVIEFLEELLRV